MRILTVPNWSFGRDSDLLNRFRGVLEQEDLVVHFLQSDVDHNRTVSAFSGNSVAVFTALVAMCDLAFDRIDLNHHVGVHPRIGALDVCPFLALPNEVAHEPTAPPRERPEGAERTEQGAKPVPTSVDTERLLADVETFAARIAGRFELPVFLYEKSERGRHEADLPSLRRGGFGGLIGKDLNPDFGPSRVHPRLGVSIVGVRDFLIAVNFNLSGENPTNADAIAQEIRRLRASGDHRFLGVRALGFSLASVGLSQVSINVTLPDITPVDPIVEWVMEEASKRGIRFVNSELAGVIRRRDLPMASRLTVKEAQIIDL